VLRYPNYKQFAIQGDFVLNIEFCIIQQRLILYYKMLLLAEKLYQSITVLTMICLGLRGMGREKIAKLAGRTLLLCRNTENRLK
jgi:hypothetical protein